MIPPYLMLHMRMDGDIHDHLTTLYMLTVEFNLRRVLELGTRNGHSTIAFLYAVDQTDGIVTSIDIDSCPGAFANILTADFKTKRWTFIQQDDLTVDWKDPVDHLFIDTVHDYDQTLKELKKYEPYVVNGGIITLHDLNLNGSYTGVKGAIDDYLKGREDLHYYEYLNCYGLAVIFKRSKIKENKSNTVEFISPNELHIRNSFI